MDFVNPYNIIEIPLLELIRNLAIGLILAVIWALVVRYTTRLLVDTTQYLTMFMLLIPSMILIISIIKSSIALSLGLVGALSIVRFRTPIKEPEELLYIFIAIVVGLGLGANQVLPTIIGFSVIALVMIPFSYRKAAVLGANHCYIDVVIESGADKEVSLAEVQDILIQNNFRSKIKRVVEGNGRIEVTLQVGKLDLDQYEGIKEDLRNIYDNVEFSVIDNSRVIT